MLQAADAYDVALQVEPQRLFRALQKAHSELAQAVAGGRVDFARLLPHLQRVVDEAVRLTTIISQFEALVVR
jgi:hypothetical protein